MTTFQQDLRHLKMDSVSSCSFSVIVTRRWEDPSQNTSCFQVPQILDQNSKDLKVTYHFLKNLAPDLSLQCDLTCQRHSKVFQTGWKCSANVLKMTPQWHDSYCSTKLKDFHESENIDHQKSVAMQHPTQFFWLEMYGTNIFLSFLEHNLSYIPSLIVVCTLICK